MSLVKATPPIRPCPRRRGSPCRRACGCRRPETGWRKTFQQKVKASESTFLAYAAPTSRSNRLPPGVPGAAFVALNVTAPPAVVAACPTPNPLYTLSPPRAPSRSRRALPIDRPRPTAAGSRSAGRHVEGQGLHRRQRAAPQGVLGLRGAHRPMGVSHHPFPSPPSNPPLLARVTLA